MTDASATGAVRRITLLTDFGTADGYVAAMKGVIASIAPAAVIDDASHDVPPGDIRAGSWALGAYWRLYPPGTVHIAVVDPGVGTGRRAMAVEVEERIIIAPDNGLITEVLLGSQFTHAVEIRNLPLLRGDISATFHGRDVFAPAAALILSGLSLPEVGPPVTDPVLLSATSPVRDGDAIVGSVVHVDRFGNLVTDIPGAAVSGGHVEVEGGPALPLLRTYTDVDSGQGVAVIGSRGFVEVSVRDSNAAAVLGLGRGATIRWRVSPPAAK
jgi:S-adenosyl-L-methionine hydrolase (adenosine-forming)